MVKVAGRMGGVIKVSVSLFFRGSVGGRENFFSHSGSFITPVASAIAVPIFLFFVFC